MSRLLILLPFLMLIAGCERRTEVRLEEGTTPRFVLSGSGRLGTILVFGPEQERIAESDPSDDTYALWRVEPERNGEAGAARVEDLGLITYGVVPKGYRQIKPKAGPPLPLVPGKRYSYWFVTLNAPNAAGYFEIQNGKAVPVPGP
jgi:hypothetical protein